MLEKCGDGNYCVMMNENGKVKQCPYEITLKKQ